MNSRRLFSTTINLLARNRIVKPINNSSRTDQARVEIDQLTNKLLDDWYKNSNTNNSEIEQIGIRKQQDNKKPISNPVEFAGPDEPLELVKNLKDYKGKSRDTIGKTNEPVVEVNSANFTKSNEETTIKESTLSDETIPSHTKLPKPDLTNLYELTHEFDGPIKKEPVGDMDWFQNTTVNISQDMKVPKWMKGVEKALKRKHSVEETPTLQDGPIELQHIVQALKGEAALNILVIDMTLKCDHMESMIICEGRNSKQVYSLARSIRHIAKGRFDTHAHELPPNLSIEGIQSEDWLVVDLGRFMIHCFTPKGRREADLEGIWLHLNDPYLSNNIEPEVEREFHDGRSTKEQLRSPGP
ncbi:Oligomerization domain-containing protein, partial [Globomyces pollinis-pini]